MKILVIYRQQEVVNRVKTILRTEEPFVRFSDSGLDGLLAARVEKFDLIICGTELPVITGFEVIRSLRTASINRNTRIIILADKMEGQASQQLCHNLGVLAVVSESEIDQIPQLMKENLETNFSPIRERDQNVRLH